MRAIIAVGVTWALAGAAMAQDQPPAGRPEGRAVGIGLGYNFPADLQQPNTVSVRFRMPSGLTFEPIVVLAFEGTSQDFGGTDSSDSAFDLAAGSLVRYPIGDSGRLDLELLGAGLVSFSLDNPDGDDNNSSDIIFAVSWGLGLTFWANKHWALSFNALNPLVIINHSSQDSPV